MTSKELFLISPPGSLEAQEIGYINVPKVFTDPPKELVEVQYYEDSAVPVTEPSNFWVLKDLIERKRAAFELLEPIFPQMLRYSLPWVLCEYGLHCAVENDPLGFHGFLNNTLKWRSPKYDILAIQLHKGHWRDKSKPIHWLLRVVANEKYRIDNENKKAWAKYPHGTKYVPKDTEGFPTVLDLESLFNDTFHVDIESPLINSKVFFESPEDHLIKSEIQRLLWPAFREGCLETGLSEQATELFKKFLMEAISKRQAAESLGLSNAEYETARKQIQRKGNDVKKRVKEILLSKGISS